jgi:hypothetical protein
MKRPPRFLVVCATIAVGLYAAYLVILPTAYLRYRLTLDVDVDGVMRRGSGVVEIAYQPLPDWLVDISQGAHFLGETRGYAITVDLGEHGLLFVVDSRPFLVDPKTDLIALPQGSSLNMLPFAAYGQAKDGIPSEMLQLARRLRAKGPTDVPADKLPMVVRFRNIENRDTIEELDPRDLAAAYGSQVRLARTRFEFTNDPISPMPNTWPKWLAGEAQRRFSFPYQHLWSYVTIWTGDFKGR